MHLLTTSLVWGVVVIAWDLMLGTAGVFHFGPIVFFAFGAYGAGMLAKLPGIGPWVGILLGGIIAAVVGLLVGLPSLRLKGAYVALITFVLHMALVPAIKLAEPFGTGGPNYLRNIPPLTLAGYTFTGVDKLPWYYLILGVSFLLCFLTYKVIHSKLGLAFIALRDAEPFAISLGIDAQKATLQLFTISAFATGIIGGFYVQYVRFISVRILGLDLFLLIMVMLVVGGLGRFPGPLIGAFIISYISYLLRPLEQYRLLILGAIIVVAIVFAPSGLMEILESVSPSISRTFKKMRRGLIRGGGLFYSLHGLPRI